MPSMTVSREDGIEETSGAHQFPHRFAIVLASEATGGAERYLVDLAVSMKRTMTEPIVLNTKRIMPYAAALSKNEVKTVCMGGRVGGFDPKSAVATLRALRTLGPDVMFINSNREALVLGSLASRLFRIPVSLVHSHDHAVNEIRSVMRWACRITTDGVLAVSESHRAYLRTELGLSLEQTLNLYPGIDLTRTATIQHDEHARHRTLKPTIGIIAGLRREKDHETFLRAARLISDVISDVRFVIVGDGPRRADLEHLVSDLDLQRRVEFLGWRTVDTALFDTLDVLVLTSSRETFPAVILESFSAGVPVVATHVGSVPDLMGSPQSGVLVPTSDPDAVAKAVIRVLKDRAYASQLVKRARTRCQLFSVDRYCGELLELVSKLHQTKNPTQSLRAFAAGLSKPA